MGSILAFAVAIAMFAALFVQVGFADSNSADQRAAVGFNVTSGIAVGATDTAG
jgi:hypothetical protein